ncbi:hypothetical protein COV56_02640 [Candidatus Kuenenbacteria bacterium CG11_big_fil_rev_8_21_14_0_20_37_9]|nr:MAG: hypothetical protein COV56_02640 [Candidatus Kuenenbacteria bacterium CG11_big_fil_rev_8_21_14_0_20_37_9]
MDFKWPVIGHKKIIDYLQNIILQNRVNHGYLFYGQSGLGKCMVAEYFARSLFCLSDNIRPCGACSHCVQLEKGIHADVIYLRRDEEKKNIAIEQVREAREKLQRGSFLNSYKMVIVEDLNAFSSSACSAILKILEEPAGKTVFLFIAKNLANIPKTIISRVHAIEFLPVAVSEIEKYLIGAGETKEQAYELSRLSAGFPSKIINFARHKQALVDKKEKIRQIISDLLGDLNDRFDLVERLAGQNKSERARIDADNFLDDLLILVRDCFLLKNMCADKIANVWLGDVLVDICGKYDNIRLVAILEKIKKTQEDIAKNVNLKLALENLMFEF